MNRLKVSTFLVLAIAMFASCSSDDDSTSTEDMLTQFDYFISFKANGELVEMSFNLDDLDPPFTAVSSYSGSIGETSCYRTYSPGLVATNDNSIPQAGVSFYRFLDGGCTADDETPIFNSLFPVGNYAYTNDNQSYGVGFEYAPDSSDGAYYVSLGGNQNDSSFEILTSVAENKPFLGDLYTFSQNITGTFNCKVYNESDASDELVITDGVFKLKVQAFYENSL